MKILCSTELSEKKCFMPQGPGIWTLIMFYLCQYFFFYQKCIIRCPWIACRISVNNPTTKKQFLQKSADIQATVCPRMKDKYNFHILGIQKNSEIWNPQLEANIKLGSAIKGRSRHQILVLCIASVSMFAWTAWTCIFNFIFHPHQCFADL